MAQPEVRRASRYVALVSGVGLALLVLLAAFQGIPQLLDASREFWVFTLFVFIGELLPIRVPRGERHEEVSTGLTFSFALVLTAGVAPAVVIQAAASLVAALIRRKPIRRTLFNMGQYTLALAATSGVLKSVESLGRFRGGTEFSVGDLPAMLLAAIVFFVVSRVLTSTAIAIDENDAAPDVIKRDLLFQAMTRGALLALAPVVIVMSQEVGVWLIPLVTLPIGAVFRSANVENLRLVNKLQSSLEQLVELNDLNKHQALHDYLTNLPNRTLFQDRLRQAILQSQRDGHGTTIMIIDLDRFKEINDTLGHHHGDMLLRQVGPRLHDVLRVSDTVARLGGDEFAVLLPNIGTPNAAQDVAKKIQSALERPFKVNAMSLEVEASIGITLYPEHGEDVEGLIRRADVAMYVAKEERTKIQVYSPEHDPHSPGRLALVGELRRAMRNYELDLYYQPQVDLATDRIIGVEALLRWDHPQHGLMTPGQFIPLAEQTGLIKSLSLHVLDLALKQCRHWRDDGLGLTVSVNLPAWNFVDLKLPDEVAGLLKKWNLEPADLVLEITESTIMSDRQGGGEVLTKLSEMGVGLSIDDFGTGYSSLAYLKHLPIREIKIDKSFVINMVEDENDAKIVRSTIDLGRNLGLRVVAEGVESQEILNLLTQLGCQLGQGFFLGRPLPATHLPELIRLRSAQQALSVDPATEDLSLAPNLP
ncbi:MAG TPA: EAL domain-containing protein [Actinomycetota bacterium]|nr:EAL domain-containing protein [Actinomycetota bacterium]